MEIDFQELMDDFMKPSNGGESAVKAVYDIIPTLSQRQIRSMVYLNYFIIKYQLPNLKAHVDTFVNLQRSNKNLGFFEKQSAKALLRANALDELVKGIKPNVQHVEERES